MGLTDRHKTAKNLVDSRKNWKILTVSRKQGKKELTVKELVPQICSVNFKGGANVDYPFETSQSPPPPQTSLLRFVVRGGGGCTQALSETDNPSSNFPSN